MLGSRSSFFLLRQLVFGGVLVLPSFPSVAQVSTPPPEIREHILAAIRIVETGNNRRSIGRAGERGAYQFRATTWRQHSREPFHLAHSSHAEVVARRHFAWLAVRLEAAGRPADPYNIALAWNAGLRATVNGRAPTASHRYAVRVQNLTHALASESLSRSP